MEKLYKSSTGSLLRNFISVLIVVTLIMFFVVGGGGIGLLKLDKEVILSTGGLIIYGVIIVIASLYIGVIRKNVNVKVLEDGVSLLKGSKVYLTFKAEEYIFTSYILRNITQFGVFTSRYLRVVDKKTGGYKDYRLYFSKKNFENLIAVASSLNEEDSDE